jgi:hypothetical protein
MVSVLEELCVRHVCLGVRHVCMPQERERETDNCVCLR